MQKPIDVDVPVIQYVARIVERDDVQRANLLIEIEKTGGEYQQKEPFNWKKFWVRFAIQNPFLSLFAPIAVLLYLYIIYSAIRGVL